MIRKIFLVLIVTLALCSVLNARSEWLGRDKPMHFVTSAFMTYWSYGMSRDILDQSENNSLIISVSLTSMLGAGKELSDKHIKRTRWSWHDMAYNGAGILFGVLMIYTLR